MRSTAASTLELRSSTTSTSSTEAINSTRSTVATGRKQRAGSAPRRARFPGGTRSRAGTRAQARQRVEQRVEQAPQSALALVRAFGDSASGMGGCRLARNCSWRAATTIRARARAPRRAAGRARRARRAAGRGRARRRRRARPRRSGPVTGIRRDRRSARHRLEQHEPERIGAARKHENVGLPVVPGELLAASWCRRTPRPGTAARAPPAPDRRRRPTWCPAGRARGTPRCSSRRPRARRTGRPAARARGDARSPGRKSSVSTPRDHIARLAKPALGEPPAYVGRRAPSAPSPARGTSASSDT